MGLKVNATVISRDPAIIVVANNPRDRYLGDARQILEYYEISNPYILVSPQFSIWKKSDEDKKERIQAIYSFSSKYSGSKVIYLCNETLEMEVFRGTGIEAVHINQNAFVDENIFYPFQTKKTYDAVYVGQLQEFKRHELAKKIREVAIIYYGNNHEYLRNVMDCMPHGHFLNGIPEELGGNGKRSLKSWEMAVAYNQSKVGLCLSEVEGAMYASIEYLLCGLPVVTTPNVGGRNDFLDEYNSLTVPANDKDVFEAVQSFLDNPVDKAKIRAQTIERMMIHRSSFFDLINGIFVENGQPERRIEDEFHRLFTDKIWKSYCSLSGLMR